MITKKHTVIYILICALFFTQVSVSAQESKSVPRDELKETVVHVLNATVTAWMMFNLINSGAVVMPLCIFLTPFVNVGMRVFDSKPSPREDSLDQLNESVCKFCDAAVSSSEREQAAEKMADIQAKLSRI
jgi:hypothetical protein